MIEIAGLVWWKIVLLGLMFGFGQAIGETIFGAIRSAFRRTP